MALSPCNTTVDASQKELVDHGTSMFPIACYHDDLSQGEVPWHWHDEWEAVVVSEGICTVAAGKEQYVIRKGEGFFINSGVLHGCWDMEDSACRFHALVFHPRLVGGSIDSVIYQNYVQQLSRNNSLQSIHLKPSIEWHQEIIDAIEKTWQAGVQEPFGYEIKMRNYLSELLLSLFANLPSTQERVTAKALRDGERIKQMLQYIHSHYAEEIKLQDIANSTSLSVSECLRCFRTTLGTTPAKYVRQYRVQKATQLLRTTEMQISEISEICGFQDLSYFTKTFREAKGYAPSVYRRNKDKICIR